MSAGALFFPGRQAALGMGDWSGALERAIPLVVTKDAGGSSNGKDLRSATGLMVKRPTLHLIPSASNPPHCNLELFFYYTPPPASPQISHYEETQGLYQSRFL